MDSLCISPTLHTREANRGHGYVASPEKNGTSNCISKSQVKTFKLHKQTTSQTFHYGIYLIFMTRLHIFREAYI